MVVFLAHPFPLSPQKTGGAVSSTAAKPAPSFRVGPDYLYPNPQLTPGKADTMSVTDLLRTYTDNCPKGKKTCTYSQDHRKIPARERTAVYNEYNVPQNQRSIKSGEVDHLYPLCAGGSNDILNLWYQPATNMWAGKNYGFHQKDDLEIYICTRIKAGKLSPQSAFTCIAADWVACYLKYNPPHRDFGVVR